MFLELENEKKIILPKLFLNRPFSNIAKEFILDFGKLIKKNGYHFRLELNYAMLWCSKKNLDALEKNSNLLNQNRVGRGIVFHICPKNIPIMFLYSFFVGILTGNSNIIKMPSQNFEETKIIVKLLVILFKKKKIY